MQEFAAFSIALDQRKRVSPKGTEYWMARDIQSLLGYETWQKFEQTIDRAIEACKSTGQDPERWFSDAAKPYTSGMGGQQMRRDFYLARYACYLVAMNGDSRKPEVAMAQTYFAIKTRQQEAFDQITEEEKRIALRERIKDHNKYLTSTAKRSGVKNYPRFQDAGYRGLYGGRGAQQIKEHKGIPDNEDLLDRAGRAELAANDFRITQTEEQLAQVRGEDAAVRLHNKVGSEVRDAIAKIRGTMPEDLPPEPNVKKLVSQRKARQLKEKGKD